MHGNFVQLVSDTLCGRDGSPANPALLSSRLWTARTTSADLRATDVASGIPGASELKHAADDDTDAGTRWDAAAVLRDYGSVAASGDAPHGGGSRSDASLHAAKAL